MKTVLKFSILALAASVLAFAGCSKDSDSPAIDNGEPKTVFVKIEGASAQTRAEAAPVDDETTVTFSSGNMYFVDAAGAITKHVALDADAITTITTSGKTITNVPGSSTTLHIFGNSPVTLPTAGYIKTIQETVYEVTSQSNDAGDVKNASLQGTGTITYTEDKGTVALTLYPMISRIELSGMTGSGDISSFKVQGIFINNYYSQVQASAGVIATSLVDNEQDIENYGGSSNQYAGLTGVLADYVDFAGTDELGKLTGLEYAPVTSGKVWAYNFITPTTDILQPHVVVRLDEVEMGEVKIEDPRFLTIKDFKSAGAAVAIERGRIYKISTTAFTFNQDHIGVVPEEKSRDVEVKVELFKWKAVEIDEVTLN